MLPLKCQRFFSVAIRKMKTQKIILQKKFQGFPSEENFKIIDEKLPSLKDGEFLAQAEFISVDPYLRLHAKVGSTILGEQVAKIIESKNPNYPVGEYVLGEFGWRTHTIGNDSPGSFFNFRPKVLKNYDNLPRSLSLGILGMPGNAAYFGLLKLCKVQEGQTVVISGASGAVGTTAGQIAKILGCRVVGITGSKAKGERLVEDLGLDAYVNYTSQQFEKELAAATPDLIDGYFDNVGGEISSSVLNRMKKFGNVAVCGSSSAYNEENPKAREVQTPVKVQHLEMEGFSVTRWREQWDEGIEQNLKWIREGRLKHYETVSHGIENTTYAFIRMLQGDNFGKTIVKL